MRTALHLLSRLTAGLKHQMPSHAACGTSSMLGLAAEQQLSYYCLLPTLQQMCNVSQQNHACGNTGKMADAAEVLAMVHAAMDETPQFEGVADEMFGVNVTEFENEFVQCPHCGNIITGRTQQWIEVRHLCKHFAVDLSFGAGRVCGLKKPLLSVGQEQQPRQLQATAST